MGAKVPCYLAAACKWTKKVAASRMQTNLILPKLHAAGSYPGSICMRQAAKRQRSTLPLAARCKLNLYVTGCGLGTFCMRLAAAICLQLTQVLNARGRVCKAVKKSRNSMQQTVLRIRNPVLFFDPWIWDPGWKKNRIRDPR
jgi:hypothetical protein